MKLLLKTYLLFIVLYNILIKQWANVGQMNVKVQYIRNSGKIYQKHKY